MELLSTSDAFGANGDATKALHRRVTVDSCSSHPRPMPSRRSSLPRPRRKSVQFAPLSEVRVYVPPSSKTWYDRNDNARFRRERAHDVLSIRGAQIVDVDAPMDEPQSQSPPCPVGLEQMLARGATMASAAHRRIVVGSVLVEQHRQRAFGVRDPGRVAFASAVLTADAFERARDRGRFQEMAVSIDIE